MKNTLPFQTEHLSADTQTVPNKIYKAISSVMGEIPFIAKKRNGALNYSFRGIDDLYNSLQRSLVKHGVFCTPEVLEEKRTERPSKSGGVLFFTTLKVKYTFYAEDGSNIFCTVYGEAMDSSDKSTNKAMSAAHKYALIQLFCIPTEEPKDTENDNHEVTDNTEPTEFRFTYGKYKGKSFNEVDYDDLVSYMEWMRGLNEDKNKYILESFDLWEENAEP